MVESVNAALQQQYTSLGKGYLRVFGLTKVSLLLAFTAMGFNLDCAKLFRRRMHEMT